MEQIIVNKAGGGKIRLFSYRNGSGVTQAQQKCELLGQDILNISVTSALPITFNIGDYIDVFGSRYKLNALPKATKNNDREFEYELTLEGPQYELIKVQYLDIDDNGYATGSDFSLVGNLEDFANLIIKNAERVYGTGSWILGSVPDDTETKTLTFSNQTCLAALQALCSNGSNGSDNNYDVAFFITMLANGTYQLDFRKPETVMATTFKYGRARGLYTLTRSMVDDKNIVTRLFAYGSTKNLPENYRNGSARLKLPATAIYSEALPYIQDNSAIALYGIVEAVYTNEDIFPERTGTVTGIDSTDINAFFDNTMPFDLNATDSGGNTIYRIDGVVAKITFKSGDLAGYTFDNASYDHATKKFGIVTYTDENNMQFPSIDNTAFRVNIGDTYTITDIRLPQSYVTAAENRLLDEAQEFLAENNHPRIQYALDVDSNFIKSQAPLEAPIINYFKLGDYLPVIDADLGINGKVPIQSFTRDLLKHYDYDLTLGEEYFKYTKPASRIRRLIGVLGAQQLVTNKTYVTQLITQQITTESGERSAPTNILFTVPAAGTTFSHENLGGRQVGVINRSGGSLVYSEDEFRSFDKPIDGDTITLKQGNEFAAGESIVVTFI